MHGFNTYGRYFQADGHYEPLWTKKVNAAFDQRSQCVSKQYSRYQAAPGLKVNGKKTLEENLADVNGLKLAYQAYQVAPDDKPSYLIGNQTLSARQVFFISYVQNFCTLSRPGVAAYYSSRSWWNYAPERYRAIGPLVNRPEFAQAFNCATGSAMNPVKKCTVW
jgi:predicted metalloendopeptidase